MLPISARLWTIIICAGMGEKYWSIPFLPKNMLILFSGVIRWVMRSICWICRSRHWGIGLFYWRISQPWIIGRSLLPPITGSMVWISWISIFFQKRMLMWSTFRPKSGIRWICWKRISAENILCRWLMMPVRNWKMNWTRRFSGPYWRFWFCWFLCFWWAGISAICWLSPFL